MEHAGGVVLAAVQPVIPMKVITWSSGIVGVPLPAFVLCMAIGRGKRVYLLALLVCLFGERAEVIMHRHVECLGWGSLALLVGGGAWWFALR